MGKRVLFISFTCTKQVNKLIMRLNDKIYMRVWTDCKLTTTAERVETKQLNLRVCAPQDLSRAHCAVAYAFTRRSCQESCDGRKESLIYWTELTSALKQNSYRFPFPPVLSEELLKCFFTIWTKKQQRTSFSKPEDKTLGKIQMEEISRKNRDRERRERNTIKLVVRLTSELECTHQIWLEMGYDSCGVEYSL